MSSDTPRTNAIADSMEHLGPGGRALFRGRLWSLARELERELAAMTARAEAAERELDRLTTLRPMRDANTAANNIYWHVSPDGDLDPRLMPRSACIGWTPLPTPKEAK